MNYTELKTNIADNSENTFTSDQYALFTQQAEQKIYNTVQIPALRKNVAGVTSLGNRYLVFPTDLLYPLSSSQLIPNTHTRTESNTIQISKLRK